MMAKMVMPTLHSGKDSTVCPLINLTGYHTIKVTRKQSKLALYVLK